MEAKGNEGNVLTKAKTLAIKGLKTAAYGLVIIGTAGATANAIEAGVGEIESYGRGVKELVSPTPVKVKKGFFGKTKTVKVNPFTGKVSAYTGSKPAINKKPVRV